MINSRCAGQPFGHPNITIVHFPLRSCTLPCATFSLATLLWLTWRTCSWPISNARPRGRKRTDLVKPGDCSPFFHAEILAKRVVQKGGSPMRTKGYACSCAISSRSHRCEIPNEFWSF